MWAWVAVEACGRLAACLCCGRSLGCVCVWGGRGGPVDALKGLLLPRPPISTSIDATVYRSYEGWEREKGA
jgi:hypothetical protein